MTCVGDWMHLRVGDLVTAQGGRHIGYVENINNSARVRVRWHGTNWLEWFRSALLPRIPRGTGVSMETEHANEKRN